MALTNIPEDECAWNDEEQYDEDEQEIDWAAHVAPDDDGEEREEEDPGVDYKKSSLFRNAR